VADAAPNKNIEFSDPMVAPLLFLATSTLARIAVFLRAALEGLKCAGYPAATEA